MSEERNYVICSKCGGKAYRIYSKEELRKKFPDQDTNLIQKMSYSNLAREFQCSNSSCCFVFRASIQQLMDGLTRDGKSEENIVKEFKGELEE
jgi:hypothetical protein